MYVTIHPACDEERYCKASESKFSRLFTLWFRQMFVGYSHGANIWHPNEIELHRTLGALVNGMQHFYVDNGYCWYNNT